MKKKLINLRGLKEVLSEKELKNVMGGSTQLCPFTYVYCAKCMNNVEAYICSQTMDGVYQAFADVCPAGGGLWAC